MLPILRFSHDKYSWLKFNLKEFKSVAERLERIVRVHVTQVDSKVLTCEDPNKYMWDSLSVPIIDGIEGLAQRREYSIKEIGPAVWDRAHKLQLTLTTPQFSGSFMVCLTHDKAEEYKLLFYGQDLPTQVHYEIISQFHKRGLSYKLGDGFSKNIMSSRGFATPNFLEQ